MESKDIKEATDMLSELNKQSNNSSFNPVALVENALLSFLEFRLQKLKKDLEFQDEIRDYIRARLPEAEFNDLRVLLNQEQSQISNVTSTLLSPFTGKINETKTKQTTPEEEIFKSANKEELQSINELFQAINSIKAMVSEKKNSKIKDALKESLNESEVVEENK